LELWCDCEKLNSGFEDSAGFGRTNVYESGENLIILKAHATNISIAQTNQDFAVIAGL
jgi:hypothetical protein